MPEMDVTLMVAYVAIFAVVTVIGMFLWWEGKIFDFPWLLRAYIVNAAVLPGMWHTTLMAAPDFGFDLEAVRPYFAVASIALMALAALVDIINLLSGANRVPPPFG